MAEHSPNFRMRILIVFSLAAALLIIGRFAFIMLSPGRSESAGVQAPALAERGSIVDREGRIIALQTRLWSVTAWKPELEDPLRTGELLGPALDMDPNEISRMLSGGTSSRFLFVKRKATPTQSDAVRKLMEEGILVKGRSERGISEEAPGAYKDIDEVIRVTEKAGIAGRVVKLRPLSVIKG